MITILIADDHPIVRRGLKDILTTQLDSVVCIEASDAEEALLQARNQRLDLLLLDVTMPGRSGLDVLAELKRTQPRLPVLMLSMHSEDQYATRVLKAGASGYLNK
ncbi:MAG: response regulator transcription factor, partial [Candidatus Korobacteraceae bacterium]